MSKKSLDLGNRAFTKAYEVCREHQHQVGENDHIWLSVVMSTFNDLIVRECASVIQDLVDQRIPASEYPERLKQHFEIE